MLAHNAADEAKVAAEVIGGHKGEFDPMTIRRWPALTPNCRE